MPVLDRVRFAKLRACALVGAIAVLSACTGSSPGESVSEPATENTVTETVIPPEPTYNETVITSGDLSGLYIDAGAGAPVVLIIPGSGPTDLNGNSPIGVTANAYKLLAEALADQGVSTVRVDKRGMFSSAGAGDPNVVTVDIYADDYSTWVEAIRTKTGEDCVFILGHSEGALMASAASVLNKNVCGQILIAGAGRPLGNVLREQLKANPANAVVMDEALAAISSLEAGKRVDVEGMHPALIPLFAPQVQSFLISLMQTDPAETARSAGVRTLVIQGTTDIQTSVEDAEILAAATGGEMVLVEGVNHVLKAAPLDRAENIRTYGNPDLPISETVVDAVVGFVKPE